jgi:hypothetical protein
MPLFAHASEDWHLPLRAAHNDTKLSMIGTPEKPCASSISTLPCLGLRSSATATQYAAEHQPQRKMKQTSPYTFTPLTLKAKLFCVFLHSFPMRSALMPPHGKWLTPHGMRLMPRFPPGWLVGRKRPARPSIPGQSASRPSIQDVYPSLLRTLTESG